jgi:alcohol dehydrogenase (NADP+)
MFAKALGAEVVVFSHSPNKKDDCMKLGADEFVTTDSEDFAKPYFDKLDYLLSAADAAKIPLDQLLTTLKVGGVATSVGLPDDKWELHPMMMAGNGCSIGTTHIGSKKEAYVQQAYMSNTS